MAFSVKGIETSFWKILKNNYIKENLITGF